MQKLCVLDLFSGIGGFSLGLERTGGFETVAFCEIEPFCRRGRGGPVSDRRSLRDDAGFPAQVDRIAACGNAVVPQIPELIGNAILSTLNTANRSAA